LARRKQTAASRPLLTLSAIFNEKAPQSDETCIARSVIFGIVLVADVGPRVISNISTAAQPSSTLPAAQYP
jgi:hypothetical protein